MNVPQGFRKAFNGFNRDDVVQYLEYINTKHNNQVNQLTMELEELRGREDQQELIASLQEEIEELKAKLEAAEAMQAQQELCPPESEETSELEMYRRAERAEQEAREKAELVYYQANSVLGEAAGKVDSASREIVEMSDRIMSELTKLQMMVSSSKQVLQEASALLNIIRPNK